MWRALFDGGRSVSLHFRRPGVAGRTLAGAAFSVVLLGSTIARADRASLAEALFRQAREAIHRGDYATACPLLAESQHLDPSTGTLLNLGACEEHEGRFATAWAAFRTLLDTTPDGDERVAVARARLASLEPRLAWLRLRVQGATSPAKAVSLDATSLGEASLGVPLALNPGSHTIVLDAPPREKRTVTVSLAEGQHQEVVLEIPDLPSPAPNLSTETPRAATVHRSGPWQTLGIAGASVGGAGIVAGAILAAVAASKNAQSNSAGTPGGPCVQDSCPAAAYADRLSARSFGNASTTAFIFGTSLVAAGAVVWLVGRSHEHEEVAGPHVGVGVSGTGIFAQGEF